MKIFAKWKNYGLISNLAAIIVLAAAAVLKKWELFGSLLACVIVFDLVFTGLWSSIRKYGIRTEFDISRVLGRDAKEALTFGNVGILIYDDDYMVTWASGYFKDRGLDLEHKKLTSWVPSIKELFDGQVDTITAKSKGQVYEISKKSDSQVLFVKNITMEFKLKKQVTSHQVVIGLLQLDNYLEYQNYENEEMIENINAHLRAPLITWAKQHDMLVRRLRSDRFLVVLDYKIFQKIQAENFSILQLIKDEADKLDVSITLSMAFAYGTDDFTALDNMVNELIELAQSRGGDQTAIRKFGGSVTFVGGNSELSTQRSKVRVRIMAQSIQEAVRESDKVYIAGHVNTDFDCMGAAIAMANWVKTLNKQAYIVLKDVPWDLQLQQTMNEYKSELGCRLNFISAAEAKEHFNKKKDLLVMVDHSVPSISSAQALLAEAERVVVIDHHRRSENFVNHPLLTYIESSASSTCELLVELLQNTPKHVPIYEADATIMYLGVLVDTNRFKMHTSARTFETVAQLRSWGANAQVAEKALCEDLALFQKKNEMVSSGKLYNDKYMICTSEKPVSRTIMSQVSDAMLRIKGAQASFTIAPDVANPSQIAISARSDGSFNVQKIMEQMQGGGHFAAAATCIKDKSLQEIEKWLESLLDQGEVNNESHTA
jgi:c-di-AMP phosphodiesterase-like protein